MNTASCSLCGERGPLRDWDHSRQLVQCPQCRLIFYTGDVNSAALYGNDYFHGEEYRHYREDRSALERNFLARLRELRRLKPAGRLLEIGSAYGFFLAMAQRIWTVRGFEISEEAARHARETEKLSVDTADFLNAADEPASQDLICLWDTIEHLTEPIAVLEKAARWLKPGGLLALTTGDIESPLARWRGKKWRQIHPPTHVFYFSQQTLTRACHRFGLNVVAATYPGWWRSYRSIVHGLCMQPGRSSPWLFRIFTLGGWLDFPVYLNTRDTIFLIAQKPQ